MDLSSAPNGMGTDRANRQSPGPRLESSGLAFQDWDQTGTSPPSKRPRILACKRCRHRKQKCDGDGINSCTNCMRANEECEPTKPAFMKTRYTADYVRLLEEKVSQLENVMHKDASLQPQNAPAAFFSCDADVSSVRSGGAASQNGENIDFQIPGGSDFQTARNTIPKATEHINNSVSPISHHNNSQTASNTGSESPQVTARPPYSVTKVLNVIPYLQNTSKSTDSSEGFEDRASLETYLNKLAVWTDPIPESVEDHLINIYFDNANIRWPFLLRYIFNDWHIAWKYASHQGQAQGLWQGYFVNMLFAVSLLLDPKSPSSVLSTSRNFYNQAVDHFLPLVLRHPDRLLHVQAYLMMSIHAIFSPSTEQIVLTISVAMRCCVLSQLHLKEAEPEAKDDKTRVEIQMRRRAFWSSYALDRLACGVFGLPYSLSDDNITIPLFDNIDDSRLSEGRPTSDGPLTHTSVSSTLHRERCLRIQSEILNMRARSNLVSDPESFSTWRGYVLSKLDNWRASLQGAADTNSKRPTDERWLQITYNLCLLYLHMPNKLNLRGPTRDWALQASLQTIMIFRKFQSYKTIPHPWLGLVSQFCVGITMLYCLWATPPKFRTDAYNAKGIFGATRACSNNLAIIAERWEQAKDLLDIFELLATEVPLVEHPSSLNGHNGRSVLRIGDETIKEIREKLPAVSLIVLNRDTLDMIEQMITEEFPGDSDAFDSRGLNEDDNINTRPIVGTVPQYFALSGYGMDQSVGHIENAGISIDQDLVFPTGFPDYDMF